MTLSNTTMTLSNSTVTLSDGATGEQPTVHLDGFVDWALHSGQATEFQDAAFAFDAMKENVDAYGAH